MNILKTRREPLLLALLGACGLIAMFGDSSSWSNWDPHLKLVKQRDQLRERLKRVQEDWNRVELAQSAIQLWNERSLPPEPDIATTLLQTELLALTRQSSLSRVNVIPAAPLNESDLGHRISLALEATGSLEEIGKLLDQIHRMPLISRMTEMTLTSAAQLDPVASAASPGALDLKLNFEAVSLPTAEPRQSLFVTTSAENSPVSPDSAAIVPDDSTATSSSFATVLTSRVLFERFEPPQEEPPVQSTTPVITRRPVAPPVDHLAQQKLVGIWQNDRRHEAWFLDTSRNRQVVMKPGTPLKLGTQEIQLIGIQKEGVTLAVDGKSTLVQYGQTLRKPLRFQGR